MDGHERLKLAQQNEITDIPALILHESEGFSIDDARILAQEINKEQPVTEAKQTSDTIEETEEVKDAGQEADTGTRKSDRESEQGGREKKAKRDEEASQLAKEPEQKIEKQSTAKVDVATAPEQIEPKEERASSEYTVDGHKVLYKRIREGDITPSELYEEFAKARDAESELKQQISKMTVKELKNSLGPYARGERKAELVDEYYRDMLGDFNVTGVMSFMMGQDPKKVLDDKIKSITQKDIDDAAAENKRRDAERKERVETYVNAVKDPKTLEEFRIFVRANGVDELTDEQLAEYDRLVAEEAMDKRKAASTVTVSSVSGAAVSGEVKQTTHSKKGIDLFVVEMADRVDKNTFSKLRDNAKFLGGYYSAYKREGAIPGFQFKDMESANNFISSANGEDVVADKSRAKPANNLREVAEKMLQDANEELGRDRKVNTAKRAAQAEGAIAGASANAAMAETMLKIADKIDNGTAGILSNIKARTELQTLYSLMNSAVYATNRKNSEGMSYNEREKLNRRSFDETDLRSVEYPLPTFHVDHLPKVISDLGKLDGYKMLAKHLEKVGKQAVKRGETLAKVSDPKYLSKIKQASKDHPYEIGWSAERGVDDYLRMNRIGITNRPLLRHALLELSKLRSKPKEESAIKKAEREIIGKKWDGYFPTPPALAERMADELDVDQMHTVLEPSAGKGSLVEAAIAAGADKDNITTMEIVSDLKKYPQHEGVQCRSWQFP